MSVKQFLARRSQNANFSLVLQAVSSSQVIVRDDSDKTVNSVLSGGLEKVYQKFLRPRMHPRVKSMPLQYDQGKSWVVGLVGISA